MGKIRMEVEILSTSAHMLEYFRILCVNPTFWTRSKKMAHRGKVQKVMVQPIVSVPNPPQSRANL